MAVLEARRREATLPQLPLPMTATRYLAWPFSISGGAGVSQQPQLMQIERSQPAAKQSIERTKKQEQGRTYRQKRIVYIHTHTRDWGQGGEGKEIELKGRGENVRRLASLDRTAAAGNPKNRMCFPCFQRGDSRCHFDLGIEEERRDERRRIPRCALSPARSSRWYRNEGRPPRGPTKPWAQITFLLPLLETERQLHGLLKKKKTPWFANLA